MHGKIRSASTLDYYFEPTSTDSIIIYDGFLPKNTFIIIGQVTMEQRRLTDMKKSTLRLKEIAANMGGHAIIVSGKQISWMRYNQARTQGQANIYDYGYQAYGRYSGTTTAYSYNIPIARYYYIYVIRRSE